MKVLSNHPNESKFDISSAFRVYSKAGWESLRDKAEPISVHSFFEAAIDVAARDELKGHERVVVCFEQGSLGPLQS